jgi:hypothetical protein
LDLLRVRRQRDQLDLAEVPRADRRRLLEEHHLGINPIVTLGKQRLNVIGTLV